MFTQPQPEKQTITLDNFEISTRGTTVLWYLETHAKPEYPPGFVDEIISDEAPFAKKILIVSQQTPIGWKLVDDFDVIFRPTTNIDWSILLTYLASCPKPTLVIAAPQLCPPVVFLQKLTNSVTLVSFVHMEELHTHTHTYQSILLPPLSLDTIPNIAFSQLLGTPSPPWNVQSVLRNLRGAGASLVASSLGAVQKQYYWYYTSKNQYTPWSLSQIQNCLRALC